MGLENLNIKSTLKEPTDAGKRVNKEFTQQISKRNLNPNILKEVDSHLNEAELNLKRKIFKLPKMEALVHGDPKLSAIYEKLAIEGKDKYGYHWNETLMNIIFNDYVLNSPKYLQKYKMTVPLKKNRRDQTGINELKRKIRKRKGLPIEEKPKEKNDSLDIEGDEIRKTEKSHDNMKHSKKEIEETTGAASAGAYAPALDKKIDETTTSSSSGQYSTPVVWSKDGKPSNNKPAWKGGLVLEKALMDGSYLTNSNVFKDYIKALNEDVDPCWDGYKMIGMKEKNGKKVPNCVPEGTTSSNDDKRVSMEEEIINETWIDDLFQTRRSVANLRNKTSEILNSKKNLFKAQKDFYEKMDDENLIVQFIENSDRAPLKLILSDLENNAEYLVSLLAKYSLLIERGINDPRISKQMKILGALVDPQFLKFISESVNVNEHHAYTKDDKIAFILQNKDKIFKGNVSPTVKQDLAAMTDDEVDALYKSAESEMGISESKHLDEAFKGLKLTDLYDLGAKLEHAKSYKEVRDAINQFTALNNISEEDLLDTAKFIRSNNRVMASSDSEVRENISLLNKIIYYLSKDTSWKDIVEESNINEKAVSQKQQKFMGMVRAVQKGEMKNPSPEVAKAAASMKPSDVEDFASTEHKGLPEKVNESEKYDRTNLEYFLSFNNEDVYWGWINGEISDGDAITIVKEIDNIEYNPKVDYKKKYVGESTGFNKPVKGKVESKPVKTGDNTKQWKQSVKESIIEPQNPSMVSGNNTSMVKQTSSSQFSSFGESLEESINKELEFYKKHLNKLNQMVNEERRHSALVNLDRLKDANEKNFKSDIKNSSINDVIDLESQPMSSKLTQEVGDNPYKLAQDIEKKMLEKTKGQALKNVGNSANEEGDEIPKRNLSKEEMLELAMNRGDGMQDIVYDNKPSEKFEERMKTDLGDDIYKLRQKKMEYKSKAPMYNKDTTPVSLVDNKYENNKYKKGFNNESVFGRYIDEFNKKRFIDFKLNETIEISKVDSSYQKISTDGMGNSYTSKIEENKSYLDFIASYDLFHKNGKIYRLKKSQSLNENAKKNNLKVENISKMKHLIEYLPSKYIQNKKIK